MRIRKPHVGVGICADFGICYIADAPEKGTYWGYKNDKYYLVDSQFYQEVDKNGKKVGQ